MHTRSARVCYVAVLVSLLGHDGVASLPHVTYECWSALDHEQGCREPVFESPLGHAHYSPARVVGELRPRCGSRGCRSFGVVVRRRGR
jgi:hypothetical protein